MPRTQPLDVNTLSPEQKRIHDEIAAGPRGTVPAPQQIWLHNPALCDPAQNLGAYCRYGTALPTALSELAILVVGRNWKADYEWWAHARIAREAGVSDAIIETIRTGGEPDFAGAAENSDIVYRAAKEMLETGRLSDATFAEANERLGRTGLIDLVGIVGYYCLISFTLNVFEVETPDGSKPFADQA
jgi:4-carboxymuconolactone decarboxylase